ncbi:hypothetical protein VOLCADRAFT_93833 [Volvox carteri f. nagariensis]|uniref:SET domain-containing protein n=1 Tax=Volvox carteri f. nagariensis TaxID=3068 RepID=D8U366_VOLCA|nr:uncharacterized protein VOLCADRAFT_93833 [Volvox carteri f. nagariensis]EFJ45700.1 hypothetical protein VOLCADRAFT_93833 [Volvox carteri f. nagariensis]|eukprot:XP_002953101.1 hypothetical protein VOLCADRAFT_93833 [Volvox carteri f. nagariensis]
MDQVTWPNIIKEKGWGSIKLATSPLVSCVADTASCISPCWLTFNELPCAVPGMRHSEVPWQYDTARPLPPPEHPPHLVYLPQGLLSSRTAFAALHARCLAQGLALKVVTAASTPNLQVVMLLVAAHRQTHHYQPPMAAAVPAAGASRGDIPPLRSSMSAPAQPQASLTNPTGDPNINNHHSRPPHQDHQQHHHHQQQQEILYPSCRPYQPSSDPSSCLGGPREAGMVSGGGVCVATVVMAAGTAPSPTAPGGLEATAPPEASGQPPQQHESQRRGLNGGVGGAGAAAVSVSPTLSAMPTSTPIWDQQLPTQALTAEAKAGTALATVMSNATVQMAGAAGAGPAAAAGAMVAGVGAGDSAAAAVVTPVPSATGGEDGVGVGWWSTIGQPGGGVAATNPVNGGGGRGGGGRGGGQLCFYAYFVPYKPGRDLRPDQPCNGWWKRRLGERRNRDRDKDVLAWRQDLRLLGPRRPDGLPLGEARVRLQGYWDSSTSLCRGAAAPGKMQSGWDWVGGSSSLQLHCCQVTSVLPETVFMYSMLPWWRKPDDLQGTLEPVMAHLHDGFLRECQCAAWECGKLRARQALRHVREHGVQYMLEVRAGERLGAGQLGVFAGEAIPADTYLFEYVGVWLPRGEPEMLEEVYEPAGLHYLYDLSHRYELPSDRDARRANGSSAGGGVTEVSCAAGGVGTSSGRDRKRRADRATSAAAACGDAEDDGESAYIPVVVDATQLGNVARFVNHLCEGANLVSVNVCMGGCAWVGGLEDIHMTIMMRTARDIAAGEELTLDYQAGWSEEEKARLQVHPEGLVPCRCGARKCLGYVFPFIDRRSTATCQTPPKVQARRNAPGTRPWAEAPDTIPSIANTTTTASEAADATATAAGKLAAAAAAAAVAMGREAFVGQEQEGKDRTGEEEPTEHKEAVAMEEEEEEQKCSASMIGATGGGEGGGGNTSSSLLPPIAIGVQRQFEHAPMADTEGRNPLSPSSLSPSSHYGSTASVSVTTSSGAVQRREMASTGKTARVKLRVSAFWGDLCELCWGRSALHSPFIHAVAATAATGTKTAAELQAVKYYLTVHRTGSPVLRQPAGFFALATNVRTTHQKRLCSLCPGSWLALAEV